MSTLLSKLSRSIEGSKKAYLSSSNVAVIDEMVLCSGNSVVVV